MTLNSVQDLSSSSSDFRSAEVRPVTFHPVRLVGRFQMVTFENLFAYSPVAYDIVIHVFCPPRTCARSSRRMSRG